MLAELRHCQGECSTVLRVKPGSINPHNDWCPWCCPTCARQAAEAPMRYSGSERVYGDAS